MSADDTYIIRYEPEKGLVPFVVMWRQNYNCPEDSPTGDNDPRFVTFEAAADYANEMNSDAPAEYGVHIEESVPRDPSSKVSQVRYFRVAAQMDKVVFTKRLLARGTHAQVLSALNQAYPHVHFFTVTEHVELDDSETVRFID
jgi:hypothetical protein